jgi:hypothetical protein
MRRQAFPLLCLTVMLAAAPALAATAPARRAAFIAPFVDDQTVAVGYLDLGAVDLDAAVAEVERTGLPKQLVSMAALPLKAQLGRLAGAGVREVYVVVSTAYLMDTPVAVVLPLPPGADADAAAQVLREAPLGPQAVVGGAVVAAQARVLEMVRQQKPVPRPELDAAFAAAGDAPVVALLLPTPDNRRVIEETLPVLPERLGAGPSTVLTRGALWASAALRLPPQMSLDVTVRSADAQAAQALGEQLLAMRQALVQQAASEPNAGAIKAALAGLNPAVRADALSLHLDADGLRRVIDQLIAPVLLRARAQAAGAASASNMHQLLLAAMMYRQDHDKEWPDNLQQLEKYFGDSRLLRNPARPELEVGYEYRKPAGDAPPQTAVLWEKFEQWPAAGVYVGYVDVVVERIQDRERFEKVLKEGR